MVLPELLGSFLLVDVIISLDLQLVVGEVASCDDVVVSQPRRRLLL